jgi:aminoacrylate hydrolase
MSEEIRTADVNGITIAYEIMGNGTPVLLLTGLGGAGRAWGDHRQRFASQFLTIVPDHRGTGDSTKAATGYTIAEHAKDMAELLETLECGPAHIVGSSTGGAMAQAMALDHSEVVRSLTLVSSWAGPDAYFSRQFALRRRVLEIDGIDAYLAASAMFLFGPSFTARHEDRVETWVGKAAAGGADPEIMAKRIDMIVAHDLRDRLGEITVPTHVVVGDEDVCTPPHLSRELAQAIPGATLTVLSGGHLIYNEQPDAFRTSVAAFLRSN